MYAFSMFIAYLTCLFSTHSDGEPFNFYYLQWEKDYYRQMDLIHELKEYREVLNDKKNILYLTNDDDSVLEATRFYSLNSNAREAWGNQTHFIMRGIKDYSLLADTKIRDFVHGDGDYQMAEYEVGRSADIEAIIVYNNDLNIKDTMFLKFWEMIDHDKFEVRLYEQNNLTVYIPGMKAFDEILGREMKKYHQK